MTSQISNIVADNIVNGVNVDQLMSAIGSIERDSENAKFQFRTRNRWIDGGHNRSTIQDFHADGREDTSRTEAFIVDADEPLHVAGNDTAPAPVEYVLHALASCLTTTMVYHASVQGVVIESAESKLEGDIDVRGFFGLSDEVRKGFNSVRVRMHVKSDASVEKLTEMAMYSAVYDIVSKSLPTEVIIEKV